MLKKIFAFGAALIIMSGLAIAQEKTCSIGSRGTLVSDYELANGVAPTDIGDVTNEVAIAGLFNEFIKILGNPPESLLIETKRITIVAPPAEGFNFLVVFFDKDNCILTFTAFEPLVMQMILKEAANTVKDGT